MTRLLAPLGLILRLVRREIPQSIGHFGVLIACIALGVGAIVAVTSLSRALDEGLQREGRVILGADAAYTLIQRPANGEERAAISRHGRLSSLVLSRGMARNASGGEGLSALVEIKAIDDAYPVAGTLVLGSAEAPETRPLGAVLAPDAGGLDGIVVDPALAARLELPVGGVVEIGSARYRIAAMIQSEPDKLSGGFGFGPRVIMTQAALEKSGLVQPGSLARFVYRLDLGPGASEPRLEAAMAAIAEATPEAGWQVASRMRASPQLQRQVARFTEFLTLVGLTALLIGGVGVANATRAFAERQVGRIATLKSIGATRSFVFLSGLAQISAFALIGIGLGLVIGTGLPWLAITLFGDLLPYPLAAGIYGSELALGFGYGLATTALFAILPLARAKAVPASTLFRDQIGASRFRPSPGDIALMGAALLAFVGLAIGTASDQRIATIYLAAAAVAIVALRGIAWLVMRAARAAPKPKSPVLRLALANLHRPGSLTPSVILSLGLGLALLVALALIDINLSRQFRAALPGVAPTFFFIDIPSREMPPFEAFLKARQPQANLETVPQLRGRIVALKGIPASRFEAAERVSWVLDGDRGITYSATPPEGSRLVSGAWWAPDHRGMPQVSFARDIAEGLGLAVGDEVTVNVLGRRITARIANLREVQWQRLGINFIMVFSPNTFAGAPHTYLATLAMPGARLADEVALAREVARAFPAISSVRVRDALEAVDKVVSQLALAIRASSALALVSSVLVLGGALAASARTRQREGVILKTLGATRRTLLRAMLAEYALLGGIAVVFGLVCGAIAAGFVVSTIMNLEFAIPWAEVVSIAVVSFAVTVILGLAGTWRLLGQKPAPYLRHA